MPSPEHKPEWLEDHVRGPAREEGAGKGSAGSQPSRPSANPGASGPPIKVAEPSRGPQSAGGSVSAAITEVVPQISYFRKAFRERVYPLTVELKSRAGKGAAQLPAADQVEVRPFLPGTWVWPEKSTVGGNQQVARFWVMPLAAGKLNSGYVEVSSGGDQQRIPLPMRVKNGRGWLFRLCVWLTILLPIGVFILRCLPSDTVTLQYTAVRPSPVTQEDVHMPFRGRRAVEEWLKDKVADANAVAPGDRSVRQWLYWLLGHTGTWLPDIYDGYEILMQENMLAEPLVLAVMLFVTLIVAWWTGTRRKRIRGEPIRVS